MSCDTVAVESWITKLLFDLICVKDSNPVEEDTLEIGVKIDRVLVDKPALLDLFRVCSVPNCGSIVNPADVHINTVGAAMTVKSECLQNNHQQTWSSSATVAEGRKRLFVINILLAAYTLLCGLNISEVSIAILCTHFVIINLTI